MQHGTQKKWTKAMAHVQGSQLAQGSPKQGREDSAGLTCLSRASFMEPEWFPTSSWIEHAPFAYWLATTLRPNSFVELGSHYGYSLFAICQAVVAYDLPTHCTAIDTWAGDEHAGRYDDTVYQHVKARAQGKYPGRVTMLRMTFDEALTRVPDGSVDLLHVDGRHFYDDARHDFETWLPKVAPGGIVMLHDTRVRDRGFGVWRLWEELAARYPSFEFEHGHGLGVLAVGAVPPALADLFAAGRDPIATANLRAAYARLGATLHPKADARRQLFKTTWKAQLRRNAREALHKAGLGPPVERLDPTR